MTKQDEKDKLLTQGKLAEKLGVRYSTIKYYTQLGLLPYEQPNGSYYKYYDPKKIKPILADIDSLKAKHYKMVDIVKLYAEKGKLSDDVDLSLLNLTKARRG